MSRSPWSPARLLALWAQTAPGKTTTIRAALGLIKLDAGEVHLFGQHCGADAPDEAQRCLHTRVGLVLDTCPFPSTLKVTEVEALVSPAYPAWSHGTFADLLSQFGLDPKAKVKDLSRGMGMKLQLACALSHQAKLLVLDEATAGLDPMAREELLDELLAFVADGQHSVLLSSHITSDLDRAADRVICIDNGSIVFDLPREDITDRAGIATVPKHRPPSLWLASKVPVPPATPTAWTYSCPTVAKRSRPSQRFPAIGQPLMTICASC